LGLLSRLPGKNCWTISEHAGDDSPDGMQHLLRKAVRDADKIRDDLRGYVTERLGNASTPRPRGGSRTPRSRCI
jgi:hypothetical protein